MSSSDVFRVARSNAKFGAAVNGHGLVASNCIQRAGRTRNDAGLVSTALVPNTIGEQTPKIKPKSWKNGSHDTNVRSGGVTPACLE